MEWKLECVCNELADPDAAIPEKEQLCSLAYDLTGGYLATGDRGGHISLFERREPRERKEPIEYVPSFRFKSHDTEFDCLKSVEIEEKINEIVFLRRLASSLLILSTNDKTVKLWKVQQKKTRRAAAGASLSLDSNVVAKTTSHVKQVFSGAHLYHMNSISPSSDGELFLSADDLRINLWNLNHEESITIVDIKPPNMEDLCEVITSACFHPHFCSIFAYSTSKGFLKVGDLREGTTVKTFKSMDSEEESGSKTFFSEIVSSISHARFSPCGRYMIARDYLTCKLWDLTLTSRGPVRSVPLHEPLRSRLCELYENEKIFDKFSCALTADGRYCVSGSYKNQFKIAEVLSGGVPVKKAPQITSIEACRPVKRKKSGAAGLIRTLKKPKQQEETYERADFARRIQHVAAHPSETEIAVATASSVYVYTGSK